MFLFAVIGQIYQIDQSKTNSNTHIPLFHTVIDQIQIHKQKKRSMYLNINTNMYMTPSLTNT